MKPSCYSRKNAERFGSRTLAQNAVFCPRYPLDFFTFLPTIFSPAEFPCSVLDIGAGLCDFSVQCAEHGSLVDCVDTSTEMFDAGASLFTDAQLRKVQQFHSSIESFHASKRYDLIVFSDSIEWVDWTIVFSRISDLLMPDGKILVVRKEWLKAHEIREAVGHLIDSRLIEYGEIEFDCAAALLDGGHMRIEGEHVIRSIPWTVSIECFTKALHSFWPLSEDHMGKYVVQKFDEQVRLALLYRASRGDIVYQNGQLTFSYSISCFWGSPSHTITPYC